MRLNLDKCTWKRVAFGDVVKNLNVTVKDPESAGIERIIAMEHLDPGELKISRWGSTDDGTSFTRRVKPGQTLFGKRRAYQRKAAYADFDAITSGDILVLEPDETQLLPEFLPFLVQSDGFYDHALGTSAGSLSPRTNWRDLANYEFYLPRLDDQKRLADLLWTVEGERSACGRLLNTLADARGAVVESKLTRYAGRTLVLGEAASIGSGVTLGPARRSLETTAPYLRVANVHRGRLALDEIKEVGATPEEISARGLARGDVLVVEGHASVDEVGRAAIWDRDESPLFQNHLFRVRAKPDHRPAFLLEAINGGAGRRYIRSVAKSTSGLYTINSTVLKALPVPAVTLDVQDTLLESVDVHDHSSRTVCRELKSLGDLRKALQAEIFGGVK